MSKQSPWIVNRSIDLSCITLGWALFFFIPYQLPAYATQFHFLAITFFVAHRYFTFPLVYMDRVEFNRHRIIYIITPILCLLLVVLCYYFRVDEPEMFAIWYLFNFFHFVRHKYGILRIYSGKAQWGHKRLDEWTVYTWSLAGFFYLFSSQAEVEGRIMHYLNQLGVETIYITTLILTIGWMVYQWFSTEGKVKPTLPFLTIVCLLIILNPSAMRVVQITYGASILLTLAWFIYEWRAPHGLNLPKVLFFLSVAFMYGLAPILSAGAMADATAFSHAAEYIAIVGLAVQNKAQHNTMESPWLSRAANHIPSYIIIFIIVTSTLLYGLKAASMVAFLVFTYGTSFMHFIYDGMIWKLRRPRVAQEVGTPVAG
jgi:hypothetical protein